MNKMEDWWKMNPNRDTVFHTHVYIPMGSHVHIYMPTNIHNFKIVIEDLNSKF